MSKATVAEARSEMWFDEYLALGGSRSIRRLAAEAQQILSRLPKGQAVPSDRTLFQWSARYGWDRRAKQHDRTVRDNARSHLLEEQEDLAVQRQRIALDHSLAFHALVRDFLTIRTPVMDPNNPKEQLEAVQDDGSLAPVFNSRPARKEDLDRADVYLMSHLHTVALTTERLYLGNAAERAREYREQQGGGNEMTVLGPEAIREMGIKIGTLVEKLSETTERNRAQRRLEVIEGETTAAEQPLYNADDPNLIWEEVPEDEE